MTKNMEVSKKHRRTEAALDQIGPSESVKTVTGLKAPCIQVTSCRVFCTCKARYTAASESPTVSLTKTHRSSATLNEPHRLSVSLTHSCQRRHDQMRREHTKGAPRSKAVHISPSSRSRDAGISFP